MASSSTETSHHPGHILSTTDGETAFFRSIIRYRPRGANRHFSMLGICKDLERELQVVIPSDQIWNSLRSCYDLDILAEMEPDELEEIDRSKSTTEILRSKQNNFFREFQLPIHPSVPTEQSFLSLVNERRLESSSDRSSPELPSLAISSPRRRTTANSLKLHIDRSGSKYLNPSAAKSLVDHRQGDPSLQEGMESDLTEQEDYEDEDEEDEDKEQQDQEEEDEDEEEDEEEEEELAPEPRAKKQKTSKSTYDILGPTTTTTTTSTSRSRNTGNSNKSTTSNNPGGSTSNPPPSTSRSRTRGRSKR